MNSTNPFIYQTPLQGVKKVVVVGSGKGGVGKSTVALHLALSLSSKARVGLLDADFYGPSIPRMLGVEEKKVEVNEKKKMLPLKKLNLQVMSIGFLVPKHSALIWRGPMLFKAIDQFLRDVLWEDLDYLIVDLPPGTGDVSLSLAQKVPIDGGIVVCTPQNLALLDAQKAVSMFETINVPLIGFVENMSYLERDSEKISLFPKGDVDSFLKERNIQKLAEIPFDPQIGICSEAGIPLPQSDPEGKTNQHFKKLAESVLSFST